MNSSTRYVIRNHNSIYYTNKRDEISTKKYLRGNNGLLDGVNIDDILPVSVNNKYVNMEYNNEHNNLQINGIISTSKTYQFQRLIHLLLHQKMRKGVIYLFQYTR